MIVLDASTIVVLGKQGMLFLVRECFAKAVISEGVYNEVVCKKESAEAAALGNALGEKWVVKESIEVHPLLVTGNIGLGEKEAISLARKRGFRLITDDETAKGYAALVGAESHGTLYVILLSCRKKIISKGKAIELVNGMIAGGFY